MLDLLYALFNLTFVGRKPASSVMGTRCHGAFARPSRFLHSPFVLSVYSALSGVHLAATKQLSLRHTALKRPAKRTR